MWRRGQGVQFRHRLFEPLQAKIENVREVMGIVPGDAVAAFRRFHCLEQGDIGFSADIVRARLTQSPRLGISDRGIGLPRIGDTETG